MIRLAVVGMGGRMSSVVGLMRQTDDRVTVAAVVDPNQEQARQRMAAHKIADDQTRFYASVDELLADAPKLDGLTVGTRCNLHTPTAVKLAQLNLPMYLEKPVAVNRRQLDELSAGVLKLDKRIVVSFPLRVTPLFKTASQIVASGRLGQINQVQAFNNVSYGGVYYAEPYREYDITGGLWLQKATHDFDYLNALLGRPVTIAAMMSRLAYGGDMPHTLKCSDCDKAPTCPESPQGVAHRGDGGGVTGKDHPCVFGDQIRNQDAGAAMIMYDTGVHAGYVQNFISRRSAGRRGATIIGYNATLTFDWVTETLKVIDHQNDRVDDISVKASTGHGGGDFVLCRNFLDVVCGREESISPLTAGLLSASMCLSAREAAHSGQYQIIRHFDGKPAPTSAGGTPVVRGHRELEPV